MSSLVLTLEYIIFVLFRIMFILKLAADNYSITIIST